MRILQSYAIAVADEKWKVVPDWECDCGACSPSVKVYNRIIQSHCCQVPVKFSVHLTKNIQLFKEKISAPKIDVENLEKLAWYINKLKWKNVILCYVTKMAAILTKFNGGQPQISKIHYLATVQFFSFCRSLFHFFLVPIYCNSQNILLFFSFLLTEDFCQYLFTLYHFLQYCHILYLFQPTLSSDDSTTNYTVNIFFMKCTKQCYFSK